jgi:hypothetical protein
MVSLLEGHGSPLSANDGLGQARAPLQLQQIQMGEENEFSTQCCGLRGGGWWEASLGYRVSARTARGTLGRKTTNPISTHTAKARMASSHLTART